MESSQGVWLRAVLIRTGTVTDFRSATLSSSKPRRDRSIRLNRRQQGFLETALAMHEHGGVLGQAAEDVRLDLVFLQFRIIGALPPS